MISEVVWNLGGSANYSSPKNFYEAERGTKVYTGRPTTWTGKVGLMYPSDYGYATSGGSITDRSTCLNTRLASWDGISISDCKNNDWLYKNEYQWTIMPYSSDGGKVFSFHRNGNVSAEKTVALYVTNPSVYLNSSVGIENVGVGSSTSPFVLK